MQEEIKSPRMICYKCRRPSSTCICKYISPLQTKTRFIILMHPKEYKKEKIATGHMTMLQLDNSEIIVGVDFTNNNRVNGIIANEKLTSVLLYPGIDTFNLSKRKSSELNSFMGNAPHIFLIDGTWSCARKMLKLSKNLQKLKRVSFDNTVISKFIIKQQPASLCLSTIESVYTVLNLFIESDLEQCETKDFLIPFEKMIEHQLVCFLKSNDKNYRSAANGALMPKDKYRKNPERIIVFENES